MSDATSQACLADGHQPQGPRPPFPGGVASGRRPGLSTPGKREWPPTSPQRSRQQAAEDLLWIIECFANCADMIGRSTYKALDAIFNRQCEVREGKVVVKAETGGDCIQKPSDADATYDAHKGHGRGYPLSGTKETWLAPNGLWVRQGRNSLGRRGTLRPARSATPCPPKRPRLTLHWFRRRRPGTHQNGC